MLETEKEEGVIEWHHFLTDTLLPVTLTISMHIAAVTVVTVGIEHCECIGCVDFLKQRNFMWAPIEWWTYAENPSNVDHSLTKAIAPVLDALTSKKIPIKNSNISHSTMSK
uniref:Uncharacterized protein n=1 Tax=Heterorhabditis bacteriophora TaxID=37862 RepID=A0A1I7WRA4_HETBA